MPLTVTKAGQPPAIWSVGAVQQALQPGYDTFALQLSIKQRKAVNVTFRDGTTGTVGPLNPEPPNPEDAGETADEGPPIPPLPVPIERRMMSFDLTCTLLIPVEVGVTVSAYDIEDAQEALVIGTAENLITNIEVDRQRFAEIYQDVDDALAKGSLPGLFEHVHSIVNVVQQEALREHTIEVSVLSHAEGA